MASLVLSTGVWKRLNWLPDSGSYWFSFVSTPPNLLASGDEFSSPCRGVSSLCREFDIKLAFLEVRSGEGVLGEWEVVKRGRLAAKNKLG